MSTTIVPGQLLTTKAELDAFHHDSISQGLVLFVLDADGNEFIGPALVDGIDPDGTVDLYSSEGFFWNDGVLWQNDLWYGNGQDFAHVIAVGTKLLAWADDGSRPPSDR